MIFTSHIKIVVPSLSYPYCCIMTSLGSGVLEFKREVKIPVPWGHLSGISFFFLLLEAYYRNLIPQPKNGAKKMAFQFWPFTDGQTMLDPLISLLHCFLHMCDLCVLIYVVLTTRVERNIQFTISPFLK